MRNYNYNTNNNRTSVSGGVGVTGLLGVAFVVLKLLGVIKWPWIWVTFPFWGGLAIFILALLIVFVVEIVKENRKDRRRRR